MVWWRHQRFGDYIMKVVVVVTRRGGGSTCVGSDFRSSYLMILFAVFLVGGGCQG